MEPDPTTTNENPSPESPAQKALAVGVQFRPAGRISAFAATDPSLAAGDLVIVEAEGGEAVGMVAEPPVEGREAPSGARKLLHRASPEEIDREHRRREKALEYFIICRDKARQLGLPMKLVDAQLEEDGKKVVFIFASEGRIDFRQLVRDLAGQLHLRIEMRQVGARDEAKHRGSIGPCGQMTCCSLHLRGFQSISISMAKHQGLAPNPAKLTGMCGKLKCCLAYEHEVYNEYRQGLPKMGASVASPKGPGKIVGHNVLKRECTVRLFGGGEHRCPCDNCTILTPAEREAALEAARKEYEAGIERMRARREKRESRDQSRKKSEERRSNERAEEAKAAEAAPADEATADDATLTDVTKDDDNGNG